MKHCCFQQKRHYFNCRTAVSSFISLLPFWICHNYSKCAYDHQKTIKVSVYYKCDLPDLNKLCPKWPFIYNFPYYYNSVIYQYRLCLVAANNASYLLHNMNKSFWNVAQTEYVTRPKSTFISCFTLKKGGIFEH